MKVSSAAFAAACVSLSAALWSAPSSAQFAKPEDAIDYRQSALTLIAAHFSRLQPVVRGQAPFDPEQVKADVRVVQTLAALPWQAFGPGTEGGGALPEVWSNTAEFKQRQQNFIEQVGKLSAAADTGDLARLREAVGDVGASCRACHQTFRKR